ncbi:MAG: DUF2716 domain-containing protein [Oscillospiraceae bacterium]|jgi:hypothetical protein|nr:DUF2716 domain-containing protein [Oscillospiraceae bacterium]
MAQQDRQWVLINDEEEKAVWDSVEKVTGFVPRTTGREYKAFAFDVPLPEGEVKAADIYDISTSRIYTNNAEINDMIREMLKVCVGDEPYMYALDWNHSSFRYNPRITEKIEYPVWIDGKSGSGDGYNVYFPTFYPNGDYYFFIARDFSWGYLGHPWLKRIYVYGQKLRGLIRKYSYILGFIPINAE